ncbi:hypothetical protein FB554_1981 [Barrientosiimonas humi]|uniref:Uncharacterized protein n=1 Tax=Barrientosiimonas humi TaxID=999931 RepID=A0A542XDC2_9MICO|nr:hypothetical protein [Barrientosiimonas humi]TQL33828.1 hypothetical protein FB554_1981 [Barrientosiimonas humi]CAG7573816.1 hypothetical protein BH39T_PBIAJDOK_02456 [Barrientosiimonas humi]
MNRERKSEYDRAYYLDNREKIAERKAEYRRNNREKIAEYNAEYRRNNPSVERRSRETQRLRNAAMAAVATRSGQPWTPHEDARLLASSPFDTVIVAAELGRTIASVNTRRRRLRKRLGAE